MWEIAWVNHDLVDWNRGYDNEEKLVSQGS